MLLPKTILGILLISVIIFFQGEALNINPFQRRKNGVKVQTVEIFKFKMTDLNKISKILFPKGFL